MPSKNRVAGYPPDHIYQKLKDFAKEHNLSESKALIQILAEHFCVAPNVAQEVNYKYATLEQLQEIEVKLTNLSELYSGLKSDLSAQSKDFHKEIKKAVNSVSAISSDLQGKSSEQLNLISSSDSFSESDIKSSLESDSVILEPLSLKSLAERFQMGYKSLGNTKSSYRDEPAKFFEWSRKKDKDGIAWDPYREDKLCYPVFEQVTSDLKSDSLI